MADRAKHLKKPAAATKDMMQKSDQTQHTLRSAPSAALQPSSAWMQPSFGGPAGIIQAIQQAIGNRAVMRLLASQRSGPGKSVAGKHPRVQAERDDDYRPRPVQRRAESQREPSDAEILSAAIKGVSTPATTLPYLDRIQASFGHHSVGHVKAHVGPEANNASRAMSALAFASGDHVVFGGTPDLRTTAHEAAHIVQQQAGVQLAGGIGREEDAYERHADAVADAVVAGRSAEELLKPLVASARMGQSNTSAFGEMSSVANNSERMTVVDSRKGTHLQAVQRVVGPLPVAGEQDRYQAVLQVILPNDVALPVINFGFTQGDTVAMLIDLVTLRHNQARFTVGTITNEGAALAPTDQLQLNRTYIAYLTPEWGDKLGLSSKFADNDSGSDSPRSEGGQLDITMRMLNLQT